MIITETMLTDWNALTFREGLRQSPLNESIKWHPQPLGAEEKKRFIARLTDLRVRSSDFTDGVLSQTMNGRLSQGWRDQNQNTIFFQDCLASVARKFPRVWTPADYVLECYASAKKRGVHLEDMDLGRGLRNLPSFVREYLIAEKLSLRAGLSVEIPCEKMNAQAHVDLIVTIGARKIYVWSYLASPHAIRRLMRDKLSGKRGKIKRGYNLLAPFERSRDAASFCEWWVPTEDYIDRLTAALNANAMSYETVKDYAATAKEAARFSNFVLFKKPAVFPKIW